MDATAYNGKDRSETMSLGECLHSTRRFKWWDWWSCDVEFIAPFCNYFNAFQVGEILVADWNVGQHGNGYWGLRIFTPVSPEIGGAHACSLHRFLDKKEMDARSKELRAAANAGIPQVTGTSEYRSTWPRVIRMTDVSQGMQKSSVNFAFHMLAVPFQAIILVCQLNVHYV